MNTIGIYPGRFQPPHQGHKKLYDYMAGIVGKQNAYVATSDKQDPVKSPLTFREKQQIWTRHDVPIDHVVKVVNPYKSEEITHKFDPKKTAAVFFLSQKDAERIPFTRKDGQPAYFQPYKGNENNLQPIELHSYIAITPTFKVNGKIISGTVAREYLGDATKSTAEKKTAFQWIFGWFDLALFELLTKKFTEAERAKGGEKTPVNEVTQRLKEIIKGMIREMLPTTIKPATTDKDLSQIAKDGEKTLEPDPEQKRKDSEEIRKALSLNIKDKELNRKQKLYSKDQYDQNVRKEKTFRDKEKELRNQLHKT